MKEEGLCKGLSPDISGGSLRQHHLTRRRDLLAFHKHAVFNWLKINGGKKLLVDFNSTPKFPFIHSKHKIYTYSDKILRNYSKVEPLPAIDPLSG